MITLSPLDGRYRTQTAPLVEFLSEAALNKERVEVEVEWMILLSNGYNGNGSKPVLEGLQPLSRTQISYLRSLVSDFNSASIDELASFEAQTHHDVKAVEYFIDGRLDQSRDPQLSAIKPLVHFGCTSEDVNNIAYARAIKAAITQVWLPSMQSLLEQLEDMSQTYRSFPLLSMTHGQPATPTTLGKELAVYVYRLRRQVQHLEQQEYLGKWNGATGTFGASFVAVPHVDWIALSQHFVRERMGLDWNPLTTQIESHDWQAEVYSTISHSNRILHNLAVDIWMYISRGVFAQEPVQGATGSSTMPHKVNPIRFENAEANLELSCSVLESLASTLVESRWQRDLTDSTTQRNVGVGLGHSLLAIANLRSGLQGIHPNTTVMETELDSNWEVLGEPIQTAMRAAALQGQSDMDHPYERVKELMRGKDISQTDVEHFIHSLNFTAQDQDRLASLTPAQYTGLADQLVDFE